MNLTDRIALVAGGTGGLGRAVALEFLEADAHVVVTYRKQPEYDSLAAEAGAKKTCLLGATVDVTDEAAAKQLINRVLAQQGQLDILVNTVGGYAGGSNLWQNDAKVYDQMMALNLKAGFVLSRAVLPVMIRQNRGWIVNVASKAGYGHSPGAALYSASKAAALALFDSLADEVKPYQINVNSIVPSIFDTPANRQAMPSADFSKWPQPAEIARVVRFLCSDDARVIRGAAIPVYGRS